MTRAEMKSYAKAAIKNNVSVVLLISLGYLLIGLFTNNSKFSFLGLIVMIVTPILKFLTSKAALKTIDGDIINFEDTYNGINFNYWIKIFLANLIVSVPTIIANIIISSMIFRLGLGMFMGGHLYGHIGLYTSLASGIIVIILLYLTGGVLSRIIELYLAFVPFIAIEKSELSIKETLSLSKEMMEGRKMELFVMMLSFIPWWILIILLTFVLTFIPFIGFVLALFGFMLSALIGIYYDFTVCKFYNNIKEKMYYEF